MIVCEHDGTEWSPDEFESCPACATQANEPIRRVTPGAGRSPKPPEDATAGLKLNAPAPATDVPQPEEPISMNPDPSSGEAPPETPAPDASEQDTGHGQTPADTDIETDEQEVTLDELAAMRAAGDFVIVLLGFPTAGKTFFLNRLQDELCSGDYTCRRIQASSDRKVENTIRFTAHRFQDPREGDFTLIDIPGERFRTGAPNQFLGADDRLMREVLHTGKAFIVMLPADETLLSHQATLALKTLPKAPTNFAAEQARLARKIEALAPLPKLPKGSPAADRAEHRKLDRARRGERETLERQRRDLLTAHSIRRLAQNDRRLRDFIGVIGEMAKLMSFIEMRGSAVLDPSFRPTELDSHKHSSEYRRPNKQVMVVLSKADELNDTAEGARLAVDALAARIDGAPAILDQLARDPGKIGGLKLVEVFRRPLKTQFEGWFENVSFQWATAFEGLQKDSQFVDYTLDHKGVSGIIDRINEQKRHHLHWWPRRPR